MTPEVKKALEVVAKYGLAQPGTGLRPVDVHEREAAMETVRRAVSGGLVPTGESPAGPSLTTSIAELFAAASKGVTMGLGVEDPVRKEAEAALSALAQRMGAMARAVKALHEALWTFLPEERFQWSLLHHKSGCACLSDEETDCSCKGTEQGRLVDEALKAFRDANDDAPPPVELDEKALRSDLAKLRALALCTCDAGEYSTPEATAVARALSEQRQRADSEASRAEQERTARERAESVNAALVESVERVLKLYESGRVQEAGVHLADIPRHPHPGAALLEEGKRLRARVAELERFESQYYEVVGLHNTMGTRAMAAEHERDALRGCLSKAEQECERLTTATRTLDAMRHLAERQASSLRGQLTTAREEGRREGLEQAAKLADCRCTPPPGAGSDWHSMCCTVRLARDIRTLATQPAQKAPRQDELRDPDMEEILAMTPEQVEAELRKAGVGPEAFSKRCGALVKRIRARQDEPQDTAALFATVRKALGWQDDTGDCHRAHEAAASACSDLERRMGAMAAAIRAILVDRHRPPTLGQLWALENALTDAPPVFTLEEVRLAVRARVGGEDVVIEDLLALREQQEKANARG